MAACTQTDTGGKCSRYLEAFFSNRVHGTSCTIFGKLELVSQRNPDVVTAVAEDGVHLLEQRLLRSELVAERRHARLLLLVHHPAFQPAPSVVAGHMLDLADVPQHKEEMTELGMHNHISGQQAPSRVGQRSGPRLAGRRDGRRRCRRGSSDARRGRRRRLRGGVVGIQPVPVRLGLADLDAPLRPRASYAANAPLVADFDWRGHAAQDFFARTLQTSRLDIR